ncbi:hypothetical protein [Streptomyces sp. NPDC018000]|uniref:hypothetical protein n=1 Tax=Streptomyces sp. NPDC018000 TaxID=3365028 RepID=UPI0037914CB0
MAAAIHSSYRHQSSNRASRSSSRTGLSTYGSASYASTSGGGDSCPAIQRNYGICDNKEPGDPKSLGQSAKDSAGGFGDFLAGTLDAIEYAAEPWCWFGADCGVQETYREKTKEAGMDVGSKEYKDTAEAAETVSWLAGAFSLFKNLIKKAIKGGTKADSPSGKGAGTGLAAQPDFNSPMSAWNHYEKHVMRVKRNKKGKVTGPTKESPNMPEFKGQGGYEHYRETARLFMPGGGTGRIGHPALKLWRILPNRSEDRLLRLRE